MRSSDGGSAAAAGAGAGDSGAGNADIVGTSGGGGTRPGAAPHQLTGN